MGGRKYMKKKYLATLLFIPLILASCGGKGEEVAGEKGEAILTQEQVDALTITEIDDFRTSTFTKVGKLNFPGDLLPTSDVSPESEMLMVEDATNKKIEVYSFLTSAKIYTLEETDKYDIKSVTFENDLYADTDLESFRVVTHYLDAESKDVYSYKYIDAFGHVLFEKTTDEVLVYQVTTFTRNYPLNNTQNKFKNDHFVRTSYYDAKTGKQVIQYWKYSDDLATVSKVDKYQEDNVYGVITSRGKFTITEKVKKEEVKTDYIVALEYRSANSSVIEVSHQGEEKMVYDRYYVPTSTDNIVLFDHHALYQVRHQLNDHVSEYTYDDGGTFYNLETFFIDFKEATVNKVVFPYILVGAIGLYGEGEYGEPFEINPFGVVGLREIKDKIVGPTVEEYVIDSELVLHDNLTHVIPVTKIGEGYIDDNNNLYDASKVKIGSIDTTNVTISERFRTCLVVRVNNKYGVINEKGEFLVPLKYTDRNSINGEVIRFYNSDDDQIYFNVKTLTTTTLSFSKDVTYVKRLEDGMYVARGDATEGAKDSVYFLGNKVDEFAKATTLFVFGAITFTHFADEECRTAYSIIQAIETDGSISVHTYRNDVR